MPPVAQRKRRGRPVSKAIVVRPMNFPVRRHPDIPYSILVHMVWRAHWAESPTWYFGDVWDGFEDAVASFNSIYDDAVYYHMTRAAKYDIEEAAARGRKVYPPKHRLPEWKTAADIANALIP